MHAQQIDITHGLLFLSPFIVTFFSSFLHHYNNKNTTNDYPWHDQLLHKQILKLITPLYA